MCHGTDASRQQGMLETLAKGGRKVGGCANVWEVGRAGEGVRLGLTLRILVRQRRPI
jgi:hypothetical protein